MRWSWQKRKPAAPATPESLVEAPAPALTPWQQRAQAIAKQALNQSGEPRSFTAAGQAWYDENYEALDNSPIPAGGTSAQHAAVRLQCFRAYKMILAGAEVEDTSAELGLPASFIENEVLPRVREKLEAAQREREAYDDFRELNNL